MNDKTEKDKPAVYYVKNLNDIHDIAKILSKDKSRSWLFRGQNDATWELLTSLERSANEFNFTKWPEILSAELSMIEEFKKNAHFYLSDRPQEGDLFEWSCIIQHFGGPTRLLDCTSSIYIAAFFAIDSSKTDSAIWCFNESALYNAKNLNENEAFNKLWEKYSKNPAKRNLACQKFITQVLRDPDSATKETIVPVSANYISDRLSIQRGKFLALINLSAISKKKIVFEGNLYTSLNLDPKDLHKIEIDESKKEYYVPSKENTAILETCNLAKVVISKTYSKEIAQNLDDLNITSATLFPGLDGFTRSLKRHFYYE